MKIINKKENQIVFTMQAKETIANAMRRYVSQIPVLAVDEVEISKNNSPLYDETIAHRIGLIPLVMDKKVNEKTIEELKLNVKKEGLVLSNEFEGNVKVAYENIPITFLNKSQNLEIVATAKVGKGVEHSKFNPGLMFYRNVFDVKIDKDCPLEVEGICPQKILQSEGGKIVVTKSIKCDSCDACVELCAKKGKDSIQITPTDELIITLESFGQLSVEEIFKRSIEELKKDLDEISKHLK